MIGHIVKQPPGGIKWKTNSKSTKTKKFFKIEFESRTA